MKKLVSEENFPNPTSQHLYNLLLDQLIYQRLQRGYQIVVLPKEYIHSAIRFVYNFINFGLKFSGNFFWFSKNLKKYRGLNYTSNAKGSFKTTELYNPLEQLLINSFI